jgi:hypothetical protein
MNADQFREKLRAVTAQLLSDDEMQIAEALREILPELCGGLGRAQAIACLYVAVIQFKTAGGSRELWMSIAGRVFDETVQLLEVQH